MITDVLTNPLIEELWGSFAESKEYRDNFVAAFVKKSIPSQIRAWMKKQGITTQQELARRSGITQGVISRAANPTYGDLALNTIIKIGSGFDCVFVGRYVPYSEFCKMVVEESFAEDADTMLSFEEENEKFREQQKALDEFNELICAQLLTTPKKPPVRESYNKIDAAKGEEPKQSDIQALSDKRPTKFSLFTNEVASADESKGAA